MGGDFLGLGLGDPRAYHGGVASGVEAGAVLGDLAVVLGDPGTGSLRRSEVRDIVGAVGGQLGESGVQAGGGEDIGEPGVERLYQVGFAQVHGAGVVYLVGQGVLGGVPAAVIGLVVVPVAGHLPLADAAQQDAAQDVGAGPGVRLVAGAAATPGQDGLCLLERVLADDRRVRDLLGPDPLFLVVPPHDGGVAERDVADVEQDFVGALAVPDLVAGVARVGQDGADGALGPRDPAAVLVAFRVVGRRAGYPGPGQLLGDGVQAHPADEAGVHVTHDLCGLGVDLKLVQALAVSGLGRVRVRPNVRERVPVGRAPAEEPSFHLGERGHGGADADLDPVALSFGDRAEDGHDQVVRFVRGVDRPADLGHPQRDGVVLEDRECVAELVAIERALRLADNNRVEGAIGVG